MIYDKIKASLSPSLARHVLSLEAAHKDLWLGRLALTESLDAYLANLADKSYGNTVKPIKTGVKFENGKKNAPFHFSAPEVTNKYGPSGQKLQPVPRVTRRCFICSSPYHLANTCPQRSTQGIFTTWNSGQVLPKTLLLGHERMRVHGHMASQERWNRSRLVSLIGWIRSLEIMHVSQCRKLRSNPSRLLTR